MLIPGSGCVGQSTQSFERSAAHCTCRKQSMFEVTRRLCRAANQSNLLSHLAGPILLWIFFCIMYRVLYMVGGNKNRALVGTSLSACGAVIYYVGLLCDVTGLGLVALCLCWYVGFNIATQRPKRRRRRSRSTRI